MKEKKRLLLKLIKISIILLVTATAMAVFRLCGSASAASDLRPADLRCEYLINPLGVDEERPRLSWRLESGTRGQKQTSYRLLVASSPDQLARKMFDTAVNMGVWKAKRILQVALNNLGARLVIDGIIGPLTRTALRKADEQEIITAYCKEQELEYRDIAFRDRSQRVFLKGWLRRARFRG